jgi:hypothetical protein
MEMLRKRLRRWLREEGLMTVIVLVICLPLCCSRSQTTGIGVNVGRTYNPDRLDLR